MDNINVLLVDDVSAQLDYISEYLTGREYIGEVYSATSVAKALEIFEKQCVDVIVTDIIMPEMDGFSLIESVMQQVEKAPPKLLVLSALSHPDCIQRAFALGVHYYMEKPFYADLLYLRILDLFDLRKPQRKHTSTSNSRSMEERIAGIFLSIGIPAHIKGYQYLREAIKLTVNEPDIINSITKRLYPGVAAIFDTSASKVERAIRHAIDVAWSRGRIDNLNELFGYDIYTKNDKPTNGEFIALVADRLMVEYIA